MNRSERIRHGSDDYDSLAKEILQAAREGDDSAVEAISTHLDHEDYMVRGAAIRALVFYMEKGEFFDDAVRMSQEDSDFAVRLDAISSVGCIGRSRHEYKERAVDALVTAVRHAQDPLEAHGAHEWLSKLGAVTFRLWRTESPAEVLATVEEQMGRHGDAGTHQ